MNWKEKRGKYQAQSTDGQIDWFVLPKKNGKFFIKAYLPGGAERRLAWQEFDSAEEAKAWVEEHDRKRQEENLRFASEEPIRF